MRDEGRVRRVVRVGGIATFTLGLAVGSARGDALPVNLSVQYQHVDEQGAIRDIWTRAIDTNYYTRLSPSLQLSSQLRLNELSYVGHPDKSFTPYGDVRLIAETFGLTTSYRPTSNTSSAGITTSQREGQITGFLARPRMPRFDVQWTRRNQDPGSFVPKTVSTTRLGRMTWALGRFEVRGGVGDLVQSTSSGTALGIVREKNWDGGVAYRAAGPGWTLQTDADVTDVRRRSDVGTTDGNRAAGANFAFAQKFNPRLDWTASYQFRAIDVGVAQGRNVRTHDGAAILNYRPTRTTQFLVGVGVRPVTLTDGDTRALGYALATATVQGRVRAGWQGVLSASQALNRQPTGAWYGVTSLRAASGLKLARDLKLDIDGTASTNSDSTVRGTRAIAQTQVGLKANPLHPWFITASLRAYRAGPNFGTPAAHSFSRLLDLLWQPSGRFDANLDYASSGALPRGAPRLVTRTVGARWKPSSRLQFDAQQSTSNSRRVNATNGYLAGSEAWSGHVLAALNRRWVIRSGGSIVDPGKSTRTRQVDVAVSARLGGGS